MLPAHITHRNRRLGLEASNSARPAAITKAWSTSMRPEALCFSRAGLPAASYLIDELAMAEATIRDSTELTLWVSMSRWAALTS